jgi:hypothetical protein
MSKEDEDCAFFPVDGIDSIPPASRRASANTSKQATSFLFLSLYSLCLAGIGLSVLDIIKVTGGGGGQNQRHKNVFISSYSCSTVMGGRGGTFLFGPNPVVGFFWPLLSLLCFLLLFRPFLLFGSYPGIFLLVPPYSATAPFLESLLSYLFPFSSIKL